MLVAAYFTVRHSEWIGERDVMHDSRWRVPVIWSRGGLGSHRPDLVLISGQQRIAIEVELTPKAPRRLRAILNGYDSAIQRGPLTSVVYFVSSPAIEAGVKRAASDLFLPSGLVRPGSLDKVVALAREYSKSLPWPGRQP